MRKHSVASLEAGEVEESSDVVMKVVLAFAARQQPSAVLVATAGI